GAVFGAIAGVLLTGLAVRMFVRAPVAPPPRTPVRFPIIATGLQGISPQSADRNLDISADGSFLVYRGGAPGSPQLFLRRFDELDTRSLGVGMPDPRSPFISPDGG